MADEQRRGTGALNFERIYSTTVPAEEVARALADHFRMQDFEAQVYRSNENRTVMQARKESLWRQLLGVAYALTVVITPGEVPALIDELPAIAALAAHGGEVSGAKSPAT